MAGLPPQWQPVVTNWTRNMVNMRHNDGMYRNQRQTANYDFKYERRTPQIPTYCPGLRNDFRGWPINIIGPIISSCIVNDLIRLRKKQDKKTNSNIMVYDKRIMFKPNLALPGYSVTNPENPQAPNMMSTVPLTQAMQDIQNRKVYFMIQTDNFYQFVS